MWIRNPLKFLDIYSMRSVQISRMSGEYVIEGWSVWATECLIDFTALKIIFLPKM